MTEDYGTFLRDELGRVEQHNADTLDKVADVLLAAIKADGTVLTAGAGHSLAAVAETFYRAGGLACVRPLYHPSLLPMHGALSSTTAERRSGLAAEVLDGVALTDKDVLIIFSTSGINPYPVELARQAKAAGTPVVAFTSIATSSVAPKRAGTTLAEEATFVLDNLVIPGDAAYPPAAPVTAPSSSLANAFLWNLLLVRLLDRATATGFDLPLWRSANVEGGDAANKAMLAKYTPRIDVLA
ncbi:sugar isomerase domain-containing protein [Kutzneria sp. NPDC051319]|uniref:sugar isomerase domain-containing protein n=1 Tax=Kutzneria sp. NPDC051319 TaxID=3155047 RepID=UPI00343D7180